MKEDLIIELTDGIKYIIEDVLEHGSDQYFYLKPINRDDKIEICKYNNISNQLDKVEYEDEYEYIKQIFESRLEQQELESMILNKIDFENLIKLEVLNVRKNSYKLKYNDINLSKTIEFTSKTKAQTGDYIYLSTETLEEDNLIYGHIHNVEELTPNNVIVIEKGSKRVYLLKNNA